MEQADVIDLSVDGCRVNKTAGDDSGRLELIMHLQNVMCPEITPPDLLTPVLAGGRIEVLALDADGRVQVLVDLDDEAELFDGVHLPHLGVLL